jgi:hypothetical protein
VSLGSFNHGQEHLLWNDPAVYGFSGECHSDPGSCFIVGGTERSWYHGSDAGEPSVRVYNFKTANYPRSQIPGIENFGAKSHATYQGAKPNPSGKYIHVTMHHVNVNVPLFILFRIFGLRSDEEIFEAIR